jgi:hypothetical protein
MASRRRSRLLVRLGGTLLVSLVLAALLAPAAALAAVDEPAVASVAWYWKDATSDTVQTPVGDVQYSTNNPFCPQAPGSLGAIQQTCAPDRIPLWIREGDYQEPYMLSAVLFDLSMVAPGSEVSKFTVTFLEDEATCNPDQQDPQQTSCRSTDPINVEDHQLQACILNEIIGGGEARPYKEVPRHTCTDADPIAERKEIKNDAEKDPEDPDPDHTWTFDLTSYAQTWAEKFSVSTGIVIYGVKPKGADEADSSENWRVVLAGPQERKGVQTKIVFTPGEDAVDPFAFDTGGGAPPSGTGDVGFATSTGPGSFGGTTPVTPSGGGGTDPVEAGEEPPELAGQQAADIQEMPGYVWLAVLAGLIGFSLVRSVVLESAAGIRPDGALAQIRRLNASRRGAELAPETPAALTVAGTALSGVGGAVGGALRKLTSLVRRSR